MIKLKKGNLTFSVATELQASAFKKNGWKVVEAEDPASGSSNDGGKKEYKKSDISRMNVDGLKSLAVELGIEVTEESTGEKLKEEIIAKLGL